MQSLWRYTGPINKEIAAMADMQSVRDDIAFMRALAEEGRTAPLVGGGILLTAGLVFGAASLGHYAVMSGLIHVSPWAYPVVWFGAAVVFMVALTRISSTA